MLGKRLYHIINIEHDAHHALKVISGDGSDGRVPLKREGQKALILLAWPLISPLICDEHIGLYMYSVYQAPSYEYNLTLLTGFLSEIAYLIILFILEVVCTSGSADHLKNK